MKNLKNYITTPNLTKITFICYDIEDSCNAI